MDDFKEKALIAAKRIGNHGPITHEHMSQIIIEEMAGLISIYMCDPERVVHQDEIALRKLLDVLVPLDEEMRHRLLRVAQIYFERRTVVELTND